MGTALFLDINDPSMMVEPWGTLAAGTVSRGMPVISSARRRLDARPQVLLLLPPIHACTSSMYTAGLERILRNMKWTMEEGVEVMMHGTVHVA